MFLLPSLVYVIIVIIVLVVVILGGYEYWIRDVKKIPGIPKYWPIFGHFFHTKNLTLETTFKFLRDQSQYGRLSKVMEVHLTFINVYHPDDVEILLSTSRFIIKDNLYKFFQNWLGEGLLISNGEKWKQRRKLLTPAFHFNILKGFCKIFNEQADQFLQKIEDEINNEKTDIYMPVSMFTLGVVCETSMGTSINNDTKTLTEKYFSPLHEFDGVLLRKILSFWTNISWAYNFTSIAKQENKLVERLHNFTLEIIQDRKKSRKEGNFEKYEDSEENLYRKQRPAMLDLLLQYEEDGYIDLNGIREEVDTFIFEGHDTTSVAISHLLMCIANNPSVQDLIYEEMLRLFGDSQRVATMQELGAMKYLECVIKETLRLYPSVPMISREINEDVVLSGYKVPAGCTALIHIFDIHRNPDFFPDPEKFIPERFLPDLEKKRHPFSYLPFSAGPRNCIGQKFVMLELKTIASSLVRRFRLEPVTKPQDLVFLSTPVLRPRDPIYVRFRLRK